MIHLPKDPGEIPGLNRIGLYSHFGLVSFMEPVTGFHLDQLAQDQLLDAYDSPHAHPWHVSQHASEFPGDPNSACRRYLTYRLANVVADKATESWVSMTGDVGKAGELSIARAWFRGGQLLAIPEDPDMPAKVLREARACLKRGDIDRALEIISRPEIRQLGFVSPDYWASGSTDLPILPYGWKQPHIVEIKCKEHDVLIEMNQGKWDGTRMRLRGPDKKHELQLKATLGYAHEDYEWGMVTVETSSWKILRSDVHERLGLVDGLLIDAQEYQKMVSAGLTTTFELDPPTTGEIYYWSRSWPRGKPRDPVPGFKSFGFGYEPEYMEQGKAVLAEVKAAFEQDILPQRDPTFQQGLHPCDYCNFASICRADAGLEPGKRKPSQPITQRISESHAVKRTIDVRGENYSYAHVRAAVFARWDDKDPLSSQFPLTGPAPMPEMPVMVEPVVLEMPPLPPAAPTLPEGKPVIKGIFDA